MTTNTSTAICNLSHHAALLAIGVDAAQLDAWWLPPPPLNVAASEQLAAHLAQDLQAILDDIAALGLVLPGALYDQTEILRPGFPLTAALADLYQRSLRGGLLLGAGAGF